jgi:hypothetical protein
MFPVQPCLGHIPTDTVGPPAILHDTATLKNKVFSTLPEFVLMVIKYKESCVKEVQLAARLWMKGDYSQGKKDNYNYR